MRNTVLEATSTYAPGYTLDQVFYQSPEIYTLEIKSIFSKHWQYAGHISEIPNPGDFFTFEFDRESIIIVRTKSGTIKAHANVCRHRGSQVCSEKKGSTQLFTCPYHAWSYDLEGSLVSAHAMPDDFDKNKNGLTPINVALVGGFIFICLAKTPPSLENLRRDLSGVFELFGFEHLKLAHKETYSIDANWKLAVENYQECYHCAPSHKEFAKVHAMARLPEEFQSLKSAYLKQTNGSVKFQEFNCYFDLAPPGQEGYQYGRNPLLPGLISGGINGQGVAPFLGEISDYDGGASEFMVGPTMFFLMYDDHIVGYRFTPSGRRQCKCDVFWFVHEKATKSVDYVLEELTQLWDVTTLADKKIVSDNQNGVDSQFYCPGRLSTMESFEQHFLDWYIMTLKSAALQT